MGWVSTRFSINPASTFIENFYLCVSGDNPVTVSAPMCVGETRSSMKGQIPCLYKTYNYERHTVLSIYI